MLTGDQIIQAFYGGTFPESHRRSSETDIMKIVGTVRSDLRAKLRKPDKMPTDQFDDILDKAVLSVFSHMHQLRAPTPDSYRTNKTIGVPSFQVGFAHARALIDSEQRAQEQVDFQGRVANTRSPVREEYEALFNQFRQNAISVGDPEPLVTAWKLLVHQKADTAEGYAYFLLNWGLPQKYGIYDHPDVIVVFQENPRLMNRKGPSQFKVNTESWRGKFTKNRSNPNT